APPDGADSEKESTSPEHPRPSPPLTGSSPTVAPTIPPTTPRTDLVQLSPDRQSDKPSRPAAVAALSLLGAALVCAAVSTGLVVHAHSLDQTTPTSVTNLEALAAQADHERG